jgi:predicted NodU family carbamoyl transferase
MRLLSIISDAHDSGLALIEDGRPLIILEEERLNRDKHTKLFPALSLRTAFEAEGWSLSDIDYMASVHNTCKKFRSCRMGSVQEWAPQHCPIKMNARRIRKTRELQHVKPCLIGVRVVSPH